MRHHSRTTRWVDDQPFTQFPGILDGGPTAVLSNTHHTSAAVEIIRTVAASVAIAISSYRDQYVRGDPCSRKYAKRAQPAGAVAFGTGAGSAATREIPYASDSDATAGENHVACLGSQTVAVACGR